MPFAMSALVLAAAAALCALTLFYVWRSRLIDDPVMYLSIALEVLLLIVAVITVTRAGQIRDNTEKITFLAYGLTLPFLLPVTVFVAIKERSRWAMGSIAVAAFGIAVMVARLGQIWATHGA